MSITEYAVKNTAVSYFIAFLIVVGGIGSFFSLGQLEDPIFTIKKGVIVTQYPGATADEVELEVTDRIEKAIQELPELKHLYSFSRPGLSIIKVDIKEKYWSDKLPQIWDTMRKKIRDITPMFPPGVGEPDVSDDFNFVYGFVLAITGDGFSYTQLEDYADAIKKELSIVEGVARVELWGAQDRVIYLETTEQELAERGLTAASFVSTLQTQNMVVDAGSVDVGQERIRIAPTGKFLAPEQIGELYLRPSVTEVVTLLPRGPNTRISGPASMRPNPTGPASGGGAINELIQIKDIATVRAGYQEPPSDFMRFNGQPALAIQIAGTEDGNIVDIGANLDRRLADLEKQLPVGIELDKVAWQSDLVSESINGFMINLLQAVVIVLVVITIPSGWRMGVIIGTGLLLTILATFIVLAVLNIPLQRMSLGALIIALGMMVDNSIVVADGIQVRMRQGMDRLQAAIQSAVQPSWSLFGATIIAVMAFYAIFASEADAGEYCRTLFIVIGAALGMSWLIAMTLTPIQCIDMLPEPKESAGEGSESSSGGVFQRTVAGAVKFRWPFLIVLVVLLAGAFAGFGQVKQMFFPDASRAQLMVDFWYPNGTRIQEVGEDTKRAEAFLNKDERVVSVSAFIGSGPPRFYLPVDPELPYQNYAELIVNTHSYEEVDPLIADLEPWMKENYPGAVTRVRKFGVGPSDTWKLEYHVTGPALADVRVLRDITDQFVAILQDEPKAKEVRTDVSNMTKRLVPDYDQARARWAAVSREDVGRATRISHDGLQVGLYRQDDHLYPIMLRHSDAERRESADMDTLQVQQTFTSMTVPLSQITKDIALEWEEPYTARWERRRTITVQAMPNGTTYPDLKNTVFEKLQEIELPPGYDIFLDGEDESTRNAQASLIPGVIPAVAVMLLIMVMLYNAYRPIFITFLTIPFVFIGITPALLATGLPFGFVALLGAMSLSGMMMKNIIVLLDEVNVNLEAGKVPFDAVVSASVARARPVLLGAGTTVLGVAPLLPDVFWSAMAVTIMAGLSVGTVMTLLAVPALYAVFYRVEVPKTA